MSAIVVIGLGQLGRVFAGGLLRTGHTIIPVNRGDDMATLAQRHAAPEMVLVAVAENDLQTVLAALPDNWKSRAALIQNELLPGDWQAHQITDPTVISVWFEKKKSIDARPLIASPAAGPGGGCCAMHSPRSNYPVAKLRRAMNCCSNWCARTSTSSPLTSPV